jgi:hypothetical protein
MYCAEQLGHSGEESLKWSAQTHKGIQSHLLTVFLRVLPLPIVNRFLIGVLLWFPGVDE